MSPFFTWKIGRIAGIELRVHWSFLLLLGWLGLIHALHGNSLGTTLFGVALLLAVLAVLSCMSSVMPWPHGRMAFKRAISPCCRSAD